MVQVDNENVVGSPAHVMRPPPLGAKKNPAQRGLTKEMQSVKVAVDEITNWRRAVDKQLTSNSADMIDLSKKLDRILELQLSMTEIARTVREEGGQVYSPVKIACTQSPRRNRSEAGIPNVFDIVATTEKTCSASGVSQDMWGVTAEPLNEDSTTACEGGVSSSRAKEQAWLNSSFLKSATMATMVAFPNPTVGEEQNADGDRERTPGNKHSAIDIASAISSMPTAKKLQQEAMDMPRKEPPRGVLVNLPQIEKEMDDEPRNNSGKRRVKRLAKYEERKPLMDLRPRKSKDPVPSRTKVWVIHPDMHDNAVAVGKASTHWRSAQRKSVPNVDGVLWKPGMQMVTIEHVFKPDVPLMYPKQQRENVNKVGDSLTKPHAEDATVIWIMQYLKPLYAK